MEFEEYFRLEKIFLWISITNKGLFVVLLTRPLKQSKNLQSLLNEASLEYVLFPAFEINKIDTVVPNETYDVIIFISVNAVIY